MQVRFWLLLFLFCLLPPAVWAQSPTPPAPSQQSLNERYDELLGWLDDYKHWESWTQKWGNKIAYSVTGGSLKNRPERPEPPDWLWNDCRDMLSPGGKLGEACEILAHWNDLDTALFGRARVTAQRTDVPVKSSFLQRIHLSGGWVPAQVPAPKVYLVAGMQVGIVELGRLTLPAVGVGLMAMADGAGGYEWKPATVFGLGYRLATFPFPGIKRQANLHLNIARVTVHGTRSVPVGLDPSQNLVGFSLTFNKAR
jgi:hypothetical protein